VKRFTVVWDDDVASQLTKLCNNSFGTPQLGQITAAANRIDKELSFRPLAAGQPIGPNLRVLVVYPLAVEYEVSEEDCLVRLLGYYLCIPPQR
jgi:hypothetical protein